MTYEETLDFVIVLVHEIDTKEVDIVAGHLLFLKDTCEWFG